MNTHSYTMPSGSDTFKGTLLCVPALGGTFLMYFYFYSDAATQAQLVSGDARIWAWIGAHISILIVGVYAHDILLWLRIRRRSRFKRSFDMYGALLTKPQKPTGWLPSLWEIMALIPLCAALAGVPHLYFMRDAGYYLAIIPGALVGYIMYEVVTLGIWKRNYLNHRT